MFFRTEEGLVAAPQSSVVSVFYPFWEEEHLAIARDTSGSLYYPLSLPDPASSKMADLEITYTWSKDAVLANLSADRQVDYHQQVGGAVQTVLPKWLKNHPDTIDVPTLKALAGAIRATVCQQAGDASCSVQLEMDISYTGGNSQVSFKQDADGENTSSQN